MITLKELVNREYDGKECVAFDYIVRDEKGKKLTRVSFERDSREKKKWTARLVIDGNAFVSHQVYSCDVEMPKEGMPLTVIAATAMMFIKTCLKQDIDWRSVFDFALGDALTGMYGVSR